MVKRRWDQKQEQKNNSFLSILWRQVCVTQIISVLPWKVKTVVETLSLFLSPFSSGICRLPWQSVPPPPLPGSGMYRHARFLPAANCDNNNNKHPPPTEKAVPDRTKNSGIFFVSPRVWGISGALYRPKIYSLPLLARCLISKPSASTTIVYFLHCPCLVNQSPNDDNDDCSDSVALPLLMLSWLGQLPPLCAVWDFDRRYCVIVNNMRGERGGGGRGWEVYPISDRRRRRNVQKRKVYFESAHHLCNGNWITMVRNARAAILGEFYVHVLSRRWEMWSRRSDIIFHFWQMRCTY